MASWLVPDHGGPIPSEALGDDDTYSWTGSSLVQPAGRASSPWRVLVMFMTECGRRRRKLRFDWLGFLGAQASGIGSRQLMARFAGRAARLVPKSSEVNAKAEHSRWPDSKCSPHPASRRINPFVISPCSRTALLRGRAVTFCRGRCDPLTRSWGAVDALIQGIMGYSKSVAAGITGSPRAASATLVGAWIAVGSLMKILEAGARSSHSAPGLIRLLALTQMTGFTEQTSGHHRPPSWESSGFRARASSRAG